MLLTSYTSSPVGIGWMELINWFAPIQKEHHDKYSTPVKWKSYLEDMGMILFAFHLARENIEQLASTNGVV